MQKYEEVEGRSIVLRTMKAEDTERIIKWRNNERVRSHFIYRETFTEAGHQNWIRTMIETGKAVQFIICEKDGTHPAGDMHPVGSVYFRDIDREKKKPNMVFSLVRMML